MANNGNELKSATSVSQKTLQRIVRNQRIADAAVHKAQEENRRLGIPNWYSINGKIVSDVDLGNTKSPKDK
jgi:hypothetical protein